MRKYEQIEHWADLKIRAFGKDKEEIFLNMLKGMSDSQKPGIKAKIKNKSKIKIKSLNLATLLVDFLNEVLYLSQIKKEVYYEIIFQKFSDKKLEAEIFGQNIKKLGRDIKAATYHDLDVRQKKDGEWEATVLFDI